MTADSEEGFEAWLTKAEAAAALNCSERTIERMAAAGQLEQYERRRPGQKPEPIYHPDDLERYKPNAFIMPKETPAPELQSLQQLTALPSLELVAQVLQRAFPTPAIASPPPAPWLTLEEAAALSHLSPKTLRRAARDGKLASIRDGRHIKLHRRSLIDFDNSDNPANPGGIVGKAKP